MDILSLPLDVATSLPKVWCLIHLDGRKVEAIKELRRITGWSLPHSKQVVDVLESMGFEEFKKMYTSLLLVLKN